MVLSSAAASAGLSPIESRELTPAEDVLLKQLEHIYAGTSNETELRKMFLDPRFGEIRTTGNPRAQAILGRLNALRDAQDSASRAVRRMRAPHIIVTTVALTDHLPIADTSAAAVVLRRPGQHPSDVILLGASKANLASMGASLSALAKARKRDGDAPVRPTMLVIHGGSEPASWAVNGTEEMVSRQLLSLVTAPIRDIPGVGRVRAIDINAISRANMR
jgi:hypothetical protein